MSSASKITTDKEALETLESLKTFIQNKVTTTETTTAVASEPTTVTKITTEPTPVTKITTEPPSVTKITTEPPSVTKPRWRISNALFSKSASQKTSPKPVTSQNTSKPQSSSAPSHDINDPNGNIQNIENDKLATEVITGNDQNSTSIYGQNSMIPDVTKQSNDLFKNLFEGGRKSKRHKTKRKSNRKSKRRKSRKS